MAMTEPSDDMSALLRTAAPPPPPPGPAGSNCLDEEGIAAVVDGLLDPGARTAAVVHLASCARCRYAVSGAFRTLENPVVTREVETIEGRVRRRYARFVLPALAAAAVVLILVRPHPANEGTPAHREPTVTAAAAPVPLAPIAAVAEARMLQWSAVRGADRYHVTLFDAAGAVRFDAQVTDTVATLPDSVAVVPGRTYLWSVEARIGWGRWSTSPLTEFSVVPSR